MSTVSATPLPGIAYAKGNTFGRWTSAFCCRAARASFRKIVAELGIARRAVEADANKVNTSK